MRWQKRLRWPELVPAFAEIPVSNGEILFHKYDDLTVADCTQATEFYIRKAIDILRGWERRRSKVLAGRAGRAIVWARVFRCRYISLIGAKNVTESDMPFPNLCWDDEQTE